MVESQPYTTTELGGQGIEWRKITPESKARKEKFEQDLAARKEKRIALAKRLQEDLENDGGVKATTDNGSILLTKNISSNAPYRVTSFLKDGTPSGHREYGSIDGLGINGAVHEFMGSDVKLEERPSLELTGQTEAELKAEDLKRAKELEEKRARENAPPPEEFTLTGSSRPADEAAARGQNELFDQGGLFRKQQAEASKPAESPKPGETSLEDLRLSMKPYIEERTGPLQARRRRQPPAAPRAHDDDPRQAGEI
jgi:hypothetical protein